MQGRNFDYGHKKSDAKEGQMARRALLTMAKDLYNLYITLNDHDDLPEWCHYKLATSRKDLSDITDYLTSKVMKMCVDKKMSTEDLRLEIKKSMSGNILEEGFFDFFKPKLKKRFGLKFFEDSKNFTSQKSKTIKALMLLKNLSVIYEQKIKPYHSDFLMNVDTPREFSGIKQQDKDPDLRNFYKSLTRGFVGLDHSGLNVFKEAAKLFLEKSQNSEIKTSSARKKPQKRSIRNLFNLRESEEIQPHHKKKSVQITLNAIKEIQTFIIAGESSIREALSEGIKLNDLYEMYSDFKKSEINLEIKSIAESIEGLYHIYENFSKSEKINLDVPLDKETQDLLDFGNQFNIDDSSIADKPQLSSTRKNLTKTSSARRS